MIEKKNNTEEKRKLREILKEKGKPIPITLYSKEEDEEAERDGAISYGEKFGKEDWLGEGERPFTEEEQKAIVEALREMKKYEPRKLSKERGVLWRIPGILVARGTTCLAGESESGKTTLSLQISKALLDGGDFLGIPIKETLTKVLWIGHDQDTSMLKDQAEKIDPLLPSKIDVYDEASWNPDKREFDNLAEVVYWHRPQVLVVDSLGSIGLKNENDNSEISALYSYLRVLMNKYDFSTLLIHHLTKRKETEGGKKLALKQRIRGAGDIVGKADCVLGMERQGYEADLSAVKARTEDKVELNLLQDPHTLLFQQALKRDEFIKQQDGFGKSKDEIIDLTMKQYGGKRDTARKAVERKLGQNSGPI